MADVLTNGHLISDHVDQPIPAPSALDTTFGLPSGVNLSSTATPRSQPSGWLNGVGAREPSSPTLHARHADVYLSELLSYSLDRLQKEPELLREEEERVGRQVQGVAVQHYDVFINTAQCLDTVNTQLGAISDNLDNLAQETPKLAGTCDLFAQQLASVMDQHAHHKQLLSHHSTLLELLEVPALMDTCVRNAIYDEALELQAFISRLALLHPNLPLVQNLLKEVNGVASTMLQQLLQRLAGNLQLPECLRIMGYLRRMNAFSETDLRGQFLRCREGWLLQLIRDLEDSDSYDYVKQLTDIHRVHLFDVVMQYRALFFDSTATTQGPGSVGAGSLAGSSVLHSWTQHRILHYMDAVCAHLPNITEGGNLAAVLEHCLYCGTSLSRVGLDFSLLLGPILEACTLQLFGVNLAVAVEAFNTRLESHKWLPLPGPIFSKSKAASGGGPRDTQPGATAASEEGKLSAADGASSNEGVNGGPPGVNDASQVPYVVMEHLPLAVFANGVLSAFNELRHCAMQRLARHLAELLQRAVEEVSSSLVHYRHTHAMAESESALMLSAARTLADVLLPHLAAAFARLFPGGSPKLDTSNSLAILQEVLVD